ncbi:hypothetical protein SAMN05421538_10967 [Paracoccus isoporae]|uniref:Uncharacterized protein n=1 Tax=Paracoccus isoporae TaxID=591205 RepID=A0A1G7ESW1_9RHOB|nr:hypothetical protein SAMN05421538_10967 [Paracoccus isoporae]
MLLALLAGLACLAAFGLVALPFILGIPFADWLIRPAFLLAPVAAACLVGVLWRRRRRAMPSRSARMTASLMMTAGLMAIYLSAGLYVSYMFATDFGPREPDPPGPLEYLGSLAPSHVLSMLPALLALSLLSLIQTAAGIWLGCWLGGRGAAGRDGTI